MDGSHLLDALERDAPLPERLRTFLSTLIDLLGVSGAGLAFFQDGVRVQLTAGELTPAQCLALASEDAGEPVGDGGRPASPR